MKNLIIALLCITAGIGTSQAQFAGASTGSYKQSSGTNYEGSVTRGYKGYIELGTNLGGSDYDLYLTGVLYTSHGYMFNPYIYLGAGIGFEGGLTGGDGVIALPIFAEFRTHLSNPNKRKHVPFLGLRVGGSVADEWTKGTHFNLFLGYRFKPQMTKGAINISLGYQLQQYQTEYYWYGYWVETGGSSAFSFRIGYEF